MNIIFKKFLIIAFPLVFLILLIIYSPSNTTNQSILEYLEIHNDTKVKFEISIFASGLGKARGLTFSPDGTLLVANLKKGIVYALPDEDKDGKTDQISIVLEGLDSPNNIAFYEGDLFVAVIDGVYRYAYDEDKYKGSDQTKIISLPERTDAKLETRTVQFSLDGKLYVSISAACDVCEDEEKRRASILQANPDGSDLKIWASGLRNTVFFTFDKENRLWGNDMGQGDLGANLPPDELNIITQDNHYGYPYCYGKNILGTLVDDPTICSDKTPTTYDYPAHVAPLGVRFIDSPHFPDEWRGDALVAFHGSWDQKKPSGYKVVRLEIEEDKVIAMHDFISGWLNYVLGENSALTSHGRPVDLVFDSNGNLYISDDLAGVIYKITSNKL